MDRYNLIRKKEALKVVKHKHDFTLESFQNNFETGTEYWVKTEMSDKLSAKLIAE